VDSTDLRVLLVAAALHVAVLGSGLLAPRPAPDEGFWQPVVAEIDVDLEAEPARPAAAPISPEDAALAGASGAVPDAPFVHRPATLARPTSDPALAALDPLPASFDPATPEPPPAASRSSSEYDGPAPPVPIGSDATSRLPRLAGVGAWVGVSGASGAPGEQGTTPSAGGVSSGAAGLQGQATSRGAVRKAAAPARPVDKAVATRLLEDSLAERDKTLGLTLPAAGNIAGAVGAAVRTALGPGVSGSGTFLAILSPGGCIVALTPVAWSGGSADAWAGAAQAAAGSLAGRAFPMVAPFQNGAVVWVDVIATLTLPSGAKSGVSSEPGGFRFDVSDIGRHRQQVVRTSVRVAAVK
jgi:hypothetical protein